MVERKKEILMYLNEVSTNFRSMKMELDNFMTTQENKATNVVVRKLLKPTTKITKNYG